MQAENLNFNSRNPLTAFKWAFEFILHGFQLNDEVGNIRSMMGAKDFKS